MNLSTTATASNGTYNTVSANDDSHSADSGTQNLDAFSLSDSEIDEDDVFSVPCPDATCPDPWSDENRVVDLAKDPNKRLLSPRNAPKPTKKSKMTPAKPTKKAMRKKWTAQEDANLLKFINDWGEKRGKWTTCSKKCFNGNRNPSACRQRFKLLCNPERKKGRWTREEDARPTKAVHAAQLSGTKLQWDKIAKSISTSDAVRDNKACRVRWLHHLNTGTWTNQDHQDLEDFRLQ